MKDIDPIRGCQSDKKLGKGFKMRKKILRLGCKSPGKRRSNVVTACHVMKVPNQRHFSNYNGVGFLLQIHAHQLVGVCHGTRVKQLQGSQPENAKDTLPPNLSYHPNVGELRNSNLSLINLFPAT